MHVVAVASPHQRAGIPASTLQQSPPVSESKPLNHIQNILAAREPCAVLLLGPSGSGKSTMRQPVLGATCHWKCDWTLVDSHVLKRENPQVYAAECVQVYKKKQQQLSASQSTPEKLAAIEKQVKTDYQCRQISTRLVEPNKNWIFDTRGNKREVITTFLSQAKKFGLPVIVIHMQVTLKTAIARTNFRAANVAEGNHKKGKTLTESEKNNYEKNIVEQKRFLSTLAQGGHIQQIVSMNNNGAQPLISSHDIY